MSFLEKIQSAPEAKKRRWMVVGVAVAMVFVAFIWLAYFNNLVRDASEIKPAMASSDSGFSIGDTIRSGLGVIFNNLKNLFSSPREYIIEPENRK